MAAKARKSARKKTARSAKKRAGARKSATRKMASPARKSAPRKAASRKPSRVARVKRVTQEVVQQATVAVSAGVETLKDFGGNLMDRVRNGG
jgi:hypothetical protein